MQMVDLHQQTGLAAGTVTHDDQLPAELGGHSCCVVMKGVVVEGDLMVLLVLQDKLQPRRKVQERAAAKVS